MLPPRFTQLGTLPRPFATALAIAAVALTAPAASALPSAPQAFCGQYPDSPGCSGTIVSCAQCHQGPPNLNAFGGEVAANLYGQPGYPTSTSFLDALPAALEATEAADSDVDGISNLEEISMGTLPGEPTSFWVSPAVPEGLDNPYFKVGEYDPAFAMRRIGITYCGQSPSFDEMEEVRTSADPRPLLHEKLDACLETEYWKNEALHRLADNRIRPLHAVGVRGDIVLGDYDWDYRLFAHVLSDGRDARELLTADYHVREDGTTTTEELPREGGLSLSNPIRLGSGQPLAQERRAGMITTQWFLVINTMFTPLPRTTAAQAYRAYLGLDIARGEGIMPVANEPRDVDNQGVDAPTCAACHSTLDPLAYAFSEYEGIIIPSLFNLGNTSGTYDDNRTDWGQDGSLFNEPVGSVIEWAANASESDPFKRNIATMFFKQALGHNPTPDDVAEFDNLWKSLPANNYSANALIHDLIDTSAFGVP